MNKINRILFVCHGNICRSPMAEFVMKQLVDEADLADKFYIYSKATSTEELGNPPYPPARRKMQEMGIRMTPHQASQITRDDYAEYDYIIGMDSNNIRNMLRIFGSDPDGKIHKLREYTAHPGDIADPWYTDDFDTTYDQILEGCKGLLKAIIPSHSNSMYTAYSDQDL